MRLAPTLLLLLLAGCGGNVVVDGAGETVSPLTCPAPSSAYPSGRMIAATSLGFRVYPPDILAWGAAPITLSWTAAPNALAHIALDRCGAIYAVSESFDGGLSRVDVFAPGATGAEQPVRTISGPSTGLSDVRQIAVDSHGYAYVAEGGPIPGGGSVLVFAPGANGDAAPVRTITHSTGYWLPSGVAIDDQDRLYVCDAEETPILLFDAGADGEATPLRSFGTQEALSDITALVLGTDGTLYASGSITNAVYAFAPGADTATRVLQGSPEFMTPRDLAIDATGNVLVVGEPAAAAFAPGATGSDGPIVLLPYIMAASRVP